MNLDHITRKTFTVTELRAVKGVPEGRVARFANLNCDVIQPAIAEINQTSRMALTATPHKISRTAVEVTITWEEKPPEGKQEAKRKLDRPKVGRSAQRDETAETPALTFPASGSVKYMTPWESIARTNCNWDHGKIADAFRSFCKERHIKLDAGNMENVFTDLCKKRPRL